MPRTKYTDHRNRLTIYLPETIESKLRMELYSELEGRVPFGAMSELFQELARNWLKSRGVTV